MIETHEVQDRGMQIMKMNFILDCIIAVLVRLAVLDAGLETAAAEPLSHRVRVVIASVTTTLANRCTTEFSAPPYDRVIEQTSATEICQ